MPGCLRLSAATALAAAAANVAAAFSRGTSPAALREQCRIFAVAARLQRGSSAANFRRAAAAVGKLQYTSSYFTASRGSKFIFVSRGCPQPRLFALISSAVSVRQRERGSNTMQPLRESVR